jgi:hypothetical protein
MRRKLLSLFSMAGLLANLMVFLVAPTPVAANVNGAAFTTDNPGFVGPSSYTNQACTNGHFHISPSVNCNQYLDKRDVWINGGPSNGKNHLTDGTYFFDVLVPGGQNPDTNDGGQKNLSDTTVDPWASGDLNGDGSTIPSGDDYANRTFTVSGGHIASYSGTHQFDTSGGNLGTLIQLFPYDDTTNPGGVYILAICSLGDADANAALPPGVDPKDCKYDAFKVNAGGPCDASIPGDCGGGGQGGALEIIKTATGAYTTTWTWGVTKSVDTPSVTTAGGAATTANYTVDVTHDGGTDGAETVSGTITITNPNDDDVLLTSIADELSDGTTCTVTGGENPIPNGDTIFDYSCPSTTLDPDLTNTATVVWPDQFLAPSGDFLAGSGDTGLDFVVGVTPDQSKVDECVDVSDSVHGDLGNVCASDASPKEFTYQGPISGDAGTCTDNPNTVTVTGDTAPLASAGATVQDCQGANLTVTKTASPSYTRTYNWTISKSVDKTHVDQNGGNVTFNYQVVASETGFTDSGWKVTGSITVTNPNDWEAVTVDITDAVDNGGTCSVTNGTGVVVPKGGNVSRNYTCNYSALPANGKNTATATWDKAAASTTDGSATGEAAIAFGAPTTLTNKTVHITDCWGQAGYSCTNTALGTLTATDTTPYTTHTYTYSHTVPAPTNVCVEYDNSARITETYQHSDKAVTVCGVGGAGALTMGFWQNKNGQGIITGQAKIGTCASATWLRQFHPFSDLSATATCAQTATYVFNVIKAATCTSSTKTCNSMLKAQMLATALDVYFSDVALGGNKIGAPAPIGGDKINLTKICSMSDSSSGSTCSGSYKNVSAQFGGATCLSVLDMLTYQNTSDPLLDAGAVWYTQTKASQVNAKDAFDSINNLKAFAC